MVVPEDGQRRRTDDATEKPLTGVIVRRITSPVSMDELLEAGDAQRLKLVSRDSMRSFSRNSNMSVSTPRKSGGGGGAGMVRGRRSSPAREGGGETDDQLWRGQGGDGERSFAFDYTDGEGKDAGRRLSSRPEGTRETRTLTSEGLRDPRALMPPSRSESLRANGMVVARFKG